MSHDSALLLRALRDAVQAAAITPPRIVMPADRYAELNGVRLHYLDWGNAHLPQVLLLHGAGLQAHTWDLASLLLRDRYHLLALSLRGHGDSGWTAETLGARERLELLVRDIDAFVAHLDCSRFALVGMSLGGLVALRYAASRPERLSALSILDSAPELEGAGLVELERLRAAPEVLDTFDAFLDGAQRLLPIRPRAQLRYSLLHALKQLPDGRWTWKRDPRLGPPLDAAERAAMSDALWRDARSVQRPTLLLRGAHSKILRPEVAERLAREMSDARLITIEGAGHNLHGDAPAAFARELDEFLRARCASTISPT